MIHRGLQRVTRQTSVQCTEAGTEGLKYIAKNTRCFTPEYKVVMKRVPGLCLLECDRVFWVGGAPCFETVCCLHYNGKSSGNIKHFLACCALNPLNPELNPICYLLALLVAHHFLHVSRIRVKSLTLRLLMSYIYIWSTHS